MAAFVMRRVTSRERAILPNCTNGCRTASDLLAEADMVAVFLGSWDVPLCRPCARVWRATWASAVEPQVELEEAA